MQATRTIPTPRILLGIRSKKWTVAEALAELIDNSFGEGRGNARNVEVKIDRRRRVITLIDDGVGTEDISSLFTLGKGAREGGDDIGRYGMGGSEALLWLADRVTVCTLCDGRSSGATVSWTSQINKEEFPTVDTSWRTPSAAYVPVELMAIGHGTYIRIHLHRGHRLPNDGSQRSALRSPISRLFAPGLRTGRHIIWNGEELQPYSPGLGQDALSFPVTVHTDHGEALTAHVIAGACDVSLENSKLAVSYSYRVVEETRDGFGNYQGGGVAGSITLGEEWRRYLTTTKDGFADENLRSELMTAVAVGLEPMLEQLRKQRASSMFAQIAVKLEATLGGLFKVDVEGSRESTEPDERASDPQDMSSDDQTHDKEEIKQRDVGRHNDQGATEIQIEHGSDAELDGRLVAVSVSPGRPIVATVNAEHPHVITALEKQPVNQMLLVSFIVGELSKELVKAPLLLIKTKLYTKGQYDELVAAAGSEGIDLLPYVNRRLLDKVAA
jgi:Histidine kinase-, DNA gyrase B-, and HSP90-like ATPase